MSFLRYQEYTQKSLAVIPEGENSKEKYEKYMRLVNGVWNPRMKPLQGWTVNKDYEEKIKQIIDNPAAFDGEVAAWVPQCRRRKDKGNENYNEKEKEKEKVNDTSVLMDPLVGILDSTNSNSG
jgi:hypothetical protein